jgi:hypothetical protein
LVVRQLQNAEPEGWRSAIWNRPGSTRPRRYRRRSDAGAAGCRWTWACRSTSTVGPKEERTIKTGCGHSRHAAPQVPQQSALIQSARLTECKHVQGDAPGCMARPRVTVPANGARKLSTCPARRANNGGSSTARRRGEAAAACDCRKNTPRGRRWIPDAHGGVLDMRRHTVYVDMHRRTRVIHGRGAHVTPASSANLSTDPPFFTLASCPPAAHLLATLHCPSAIQRCISATVHANKLAKLRDSRFAGGFVASEPSSLAAQVSAALPAPFHERAPAGGPVALAAHCHVHDLLKAARSAVSLPPWAVDPRGPPAFWRPRWSALDAVCIASAAPALASCWLAVARV